MSCRRGKDRASPSGRAASVATICNRAGTWISGSSVSSVTGVAATLSGADPRTTTHRATASTSHTPRGPANAPPAPTTITAIATPKPTQSSRIGLHPGGNPAHDDQLCRQRIGAVHDPVAHTVVVQNALEHRHGDQGRADDRRSERPRPLTYRAAADPGQRAPLERHDQGDPTSHAVDHRQAGRGRPLERALRTFTQSRGLYGLAGSKRNFRLKLGTHCMGIRMLALHETRFQNVAPLSPSPA